MRKQSQLNTQLRLEIRFVNAEQRQLAEKAAEHAGVKSFNAWIVPIIVAAARRELAPMPPELV